MLNLTVEPIVFAHDQNHGFQIQWSDTKLCLLYLKLYTNYNEDVRALQGNQESFERIFQLQTSTCLFCLSFSELAHCSSMNHLELFSWTSFFSYSALLSECSDGIGGSQIGNCGSEQAYHQTGHNVPSGKGTSLSCMVNTLQNYWTWSWSSAVYQYCCFRKIFLNAVEELMLWHEHVMGNYNSK